MESLKLCCVAPHPPILVPEVGGREVRKVEKSASALGRLAADIKESGAETVVVMSPHSPVFGDAFLIQTSPTLFGSFAYFGAPGVSIRSTTDSDLASAIEDAARSSGIPVAGEAAKSARVSGELDHGILVPLYFIAPEKYRLVCVSLSFLPYEEHYAFGTAIRDGIEEVGRRAVFVASGDMSHRLTPRAPAGYSPSGEVFDREIVDIMDSGDFGRLFGLDKRMIEEAGECGLRSIFALAGAMDGHAVDSEVLSYEGPFGVGYLVARAIPGGPDPSRSFAR